MGRSPKIGLDYFRLDVQLDDKFELIEAEFGLLGFAVVVRLYQRIYGGAGYYCEWNDEVALVFASRNHVGANVVSEIVKAAIKRKLFDKSLFEKYGILTSTGIQKWYFDAVSRREQVDVIREYLLLPVASLPISVSIKAISVDINPFSVDRNPQSRAEESIGEEEKEREGAPAIDAAFQAFSRLYQSELGMLPTSSIALGDLRTFYDEFGLQAISEIIRCTARKNLDNPKTYFAAVCRNLLGKGIRTAEQVQAAFKDHERKYKKKPPAAQPAEYAQPEDFYG